MNYQNTKCSHMATCTRTLGATHLYLFSVIDFKTIPIRCCASLMLQNYVASHIGSEDSKNRDDLISMATRCELNKKNLEPQQVPMKIDAWSLQGIFLSLNDRTWRYDGYFHLFKESLCNASDNLMSYMYPRWNENNRCRASLSLKSGTMQISTTQHKHFKSRLKDNLKILLLKTDAVPSMKTKVRNESVKV